MIEYLLQIISFLSIVFIEFGFFHSLSGFISLVPITICVGVYHIFHLRPYIGLAWLVGFGVVQDLHSVFALGDVIITAVLGLALIFIVEQYITHISLYSAIGAAVSFVILWTSGRALIAVMFFESVSFDLWFKESVATVILGALTMWVLMLGIPRLGTYISNRVRIG